MLHWAPPTLWCDRVVLADQSDCEHWNYGHDHLKIDLVKQACLYEGSDEGFYEDYDGYDHSESIDCESDERPTNLSCLSDYVCQSPYVSVVHRQSAWMRRASESEQETGSSHSCVSLSSPCS